MIDGSCVPTHEAAFHFVAKIRAGNYAVFRTPAQASSPLDELQMGLADVEVATLRAHDGGALIGQSLRESNLRELYGVTVVAVRRGDDFESNPPGDMRIASGDVLTVLGTPEEVACVQSLLRDREAVDGTAPDARR